MNLRLLPTSAWVCMASAALAAAGPLGCNTLFGVSDLRADDGPMGGHGPEGGHGPGGEGHAGSGAQAGGGVGGGTAGGPQNIYGAIRANSHASKAPAAASYESALWADFGPRQCVLAAEAPPCNRWVCQTSNGSGGSLPTPVVGTIHVSGATHQPSVELVHDSTGVYTSNLVSDQPFFADADQLHFEAAGDEVPAFWAQVTAPSIVTVAQPDLVNLMSIPVASDLVVTWTGQTAGSVELTLNGFNGPNPDQTDNIVCSFQSSAGTGTLPAAMLQLLASYNEHWLMVRSGNWHELSGVLSTGADWVVGIGLKRQAVTVDGERAHVPVALK